MPFVRVYQINIPKFKKICMRYPEFQNFIIMRSTQRIAYFEH